MEKKKGSAWQGIRKEEEDAQKQKKIIDNSSPARRVIPVRRNRDLIASKEGLRFSAFSSHLIGESETLLAF